MPSGLAALLDDVAAITKLAAASLDDVGAAAGKAGTKAVGVVVDDAAVTPGYAMGFTPEPQKLPKLTALLMKIRFDVGDAVNKPKDLYQRKRPYLIDEGPICVDKTEGLAKSPDYPSGHTTWGWTVGLILAEADPAHATAILTRARAFGESRVVCGVHNASAIEAGRTNASALVAALHGSKAFRDDLDGVRAELDEARKSAVAAPAAQCAAEQALTAQTPW